MRSPGINGEGELRGQPANAGSPGQMAIKTECVCVCVHVCVRACADDAKLFHHILHASNHCSLQSGINKLRDWTQNWLLKININKCKVLSVGRDVGKSNIYYNRK